MGGTTASFRFVGATRAGARHLRLGSDNEDAWHAETLGDLVLVAVADGASSAEYSARASRRAVHAAVAAARAQLRADDTPGDALTRGTNATEAPAGQWCFPQTWHEMARTVVVAASLEVMKLDESIESVACTLLFAIFGPAVTVVAQVGDGACVASFGRAPATTLTRPDSGEGINETTFLTSADALRRAQFVVEMRPVRHAALFTDGLQLLALNFPSWEPHGGFFHPLFDFVSRSGGLASEQEELQRFLGSPGVVERTDDDSTLVLVAATNAIGPEANP